MVFTKCRIVSIAPYTRTAPYGISSKRMRAPVLLPSCAVALLVLATLQPSPAVAAGFYVADVGARPMARGGAFVASPDSPLALHYNPAGLSLLKGLHFEVSSAFVSYSAQFARTCPCLDSVLNDAQTVAEGDARLEAGFRDNGAESSTFLAIPAVAIAYGFEPLNTAIGFAVFGPTSGRHDYGLLGTASDPTFVERAGRKVTRYSALEAPNLEVNYVLGASFEPIEGLRLGFGFYLFQSGASQTLHLFADSNFVARGPEDTSADVPILLDFLSDPSPNWQIGVSYDIPFVPGLTVGGSFRGERVVRASGTISVDLPLELQEVANVEGQDVDVRLKTAPIARAGLQYRRPDVFSAEVAFVWEGWSANERITIQADEILFEIEGLNPVLLGEIVSERRWQDTWSLRVGGEVELLEPWLGVQAGYFYEPTAIPSDRLDPSRVDLDKHGFALGVATTHFGITLQLTVLYVALEGVSVTNSRVQNTAPLGFAPQFRTTVGNGRYDASYLIGSASLSFVLDDFLEAI